MAWITITEADVLTTLSGAELEGYRSAALADGQPDPVAATIAQVIDLVRGYVGGCPRHVLGEAGTIPQKLLAPALDIIAARIPLRVNRSPKEGRKTAQENAIKVLEQVAAFKFDIEEPLVATTEVSAAAVRPSFNGRPRRDYRRESRGL